ncbi:hypothetical protein [Pendulispora albinea]|uniref:Uncharacterized protein n=1 Tax=Pendulispora albinea TaxID=2741071 RepID=A0ABZ2M8Q6_9BACT
MVRLEPEEIIRRNPKLNRERIARYLEIMRVSEPPRYRLDPPIGKIRTLEDQEVDDG